MRKPTIRVATVILAGGQGTRLYPLTAHHSKPAVSYGGRYRLIDIPISNSINSDFRQIFVIAQYLSGELEHHISQTYHFDAFNPGSVDVLTPQENEKGEKQWFTGTADAVRKSLPTLLKSSADYYLILAGDQLYNINFQDMVDFAEKTGAELTIASILVPEKEAIRMGVLKTDGQARILDFYEKPQGKETFARFAIAAKRGEKEPLYLGSMGIYVFKRDALISLLQCDLRPDFGFHLIDTAVKRGNAFAFHYSGYWEDIGTIASYYEANLILTHGGKGLDTYDEKNPIYTRPTFLPGPKITCTKVMNSIICEGCLIEAAEIHHCVIGLRSRIGPGTILRDTVMMGDHFYMPPLHDDKPIPADFGIGANCLIEKAIIDEHVQIGDNVKLINQNKREQHDAGNGVFIRDGIIIVTAGTRLPDNYLL